MKPFITSLASAKGARDSGAPSIDTAPALLYGPALVVVGRRPQPPRTGVSGPASLIAGEEAMKVVHSLKTAKKRDKNCRIVRRRGRIYVINKKNPRFKARQG